MAPSVETPVLAENESDPNAGSSNDTRTFVVATANADTVDSSVDERVLEIHVEAGSEITLAYTHSVEKTPVEDVYVVNGTLLDHDRMVFNSFGAGLPSEAEVNRTDDGLVASIDRTFERVYVVPGSIAGHELIVDDDRYDLVDIADGERLVFFLEVESPTTESKPLEASGTACETPAPNEPLPNER